MPKLKTSPDQEANTYLIATLKKYQYLSGIDRAEMSAAMKMSEATYYSRMKKPDTFTVSELRNAAKKLHIPETEFLEMIFGQKGA